MSNSMQTNSNNYWKIHKKDFISAFKLISTHLQSIFIHQKLFLSFYWKLAYCTLSPSMGIPDISDINRGIFSHQGWVMHIYYRIQHEFAMWSKQGDRGSDGMKKLSDISKSEFCNLQFKHTVKNHIHCRWAITLDWKKPAAMKKKRPPQCTYL